MSKSNETLEKLNRISAENFGVMGSTDFYFGKITAKVQEILLKLIPYGRAVLLCNKVDYYDKVEAVVEALYLNDIKVTVIYNPTEESIASIPENARAVIAFGNDNFNLAGRIATEKNLYALFVIDQFNFDNVLNSYYEIEKEGKKKKIRLDFDRRIILDVDKIIEDENGMAEEFAFVMSKLIALVDYRIFGIITETPTNKNAYNLIKGAVEETFSLFSKNREDYVLSLLENALKIRLADAITLGKFLQVSSADICARLSGEKHAVLSYSKRIAKIYSLAFSSEFDGVGEPDYLSRAEELAKLSSATEVESSKWLVYQSELCAKKAKEISIIKEKLYVETSSYLKIFEQVEKTYLALGGAKMKTNDSLVKVSGDFFETFNGMTLVRDTGIAEFL